MTYREPSGRPEAELDALRELDRRLASGVRRILLPLLAVAFAIGAVSAITYLLDAWSIPGFVPTWSMARHTVGAAVSTTFLVPFGLIFAPGYLAYRRWVGAQKRRWLEEVRERGLDADSLERSAQIFR